MSLWRLDWHLALHLFNKVIDITINGSKLVHPIHIKDGRESKHMSEHLRILLEKLETLSGGHGMPTHESSCDKYHPAVGVSTLDVKLPTPDKHGMFRAAQFNPTDIQKAKAAVQNKSATTEDIDLLTLYKRFQLQQDTIAKKNARLEREKALHERHAHAKAMEEKEKKKQENAQVRAHRADFHNRWEDFLEREREAQDRAEQPDRFPWEWDTARMLCASPARP